MEKKQITKTYAKRAANGETVDKTIEFSESEYKKYESAIYMDSGVSCYDQNGNFIENPFEKFPFSYIVDYSKDVYTILMNLSMDYCMPFVGDKPIDNERVAKFVFKEAPYSDGDYTIPGFFEEVKMEEIEKEQIECPF